MEAQVKGFLALACRCMSQAFACALVRQSPLVLGRSSALARIQMSPATVLKHIETAEQLSIGVSGNSDVGLPEFTVLQLAMALIAPMLKMAE